jgi:hypothetical protein
MKQQRMSYTIINTLVTDIDPDIQVKNYEQD